MADASSTPTAARIDGMVLYVADMQRSKEFYAGTLGLNVPYEDDTMVQVQDAGGHFSVLLETEEGRQLGGNGFELQLLVDDVDAAYERLRARGVTFDGPPQDQWWGARHAFFTDPDGWRLTIYKPTEQG